jgi:hypothetical protein
MVIEIFGNVLGPVFKAVKGQMAWSHVDFLSALSVLQLAAAFHNFP